MGTRTARPLVTFGFLLAGFVITGVALQAHHAVAGVYDLNKEVVLEGRLKKLNFRNPHPSIELSVPDKDGKVTDWILTTASHPSGEERKPEWIHQKSPTRGPQHPASHRITEYVGSWSCLIAE